MAVASAELRYGSHDPALLAIAATGVLLVGGAVSLAANHSQPSTSAGQTYLERVMPAVLYPEFNPLGRIAVDSSKHEVAFSIANGSRTRNCVGKYTVKLFEKRGTHPAVDVYDVQCINTDKPIP